MVARGAVAPIEVIGIGAQKAGTTSLWAALRTQAWFGPARMKEVHYFDFNHGLGLDWYHGHFPEPAEGLVRGEISPDYLGNRFAPLRMSRYNPDLRLVAVLRDPVERAFSAYLHAQRLGAIPPRATFEESLRREPARYGAPWSNLVEGGLYYRQLRRYLEHFPPDQLHVLLFEDLIDPASGALRAALAFMAGSEDRVTDAPIHHRNRYRTSRAPRTLRSIRWLASQARRHGRFITHDRLLAAGRRLLHDADVERPGMEPHVRAMLRERYAPENAALESLLGRSLARWQ